MFYVWFTRRGAKLACGGPPFLPTASQSNGRGQTNRFRSVRLYRILMEWVSLRGRINLVHFSSFASTLHLFYKSTAMTNSVSSSSWSLVSYASSKTFRSGGREQQSRVLCITSKWMKNRPDGRMVANNQRFAFYSTTLSATGRPFQWWE